MPGNCMDNKIIIKKGIVMGIGFDFPYIKGMTFGFQAKRGEFARNETYQSFDLMAETLNINTVVLPVVAWQKSAQSTEIDFCGEGTVSSWEIENMVDYAHRKGIRVILKPMVNVIDGTLRTDIGFSDTDVTFEHYWKDWFKSYSEFILHMAEIASTTGCSIFSVGCGLGRSEKCETEWRTLIAAVREKYSGFITYNTYRNFENSICWWDAVDLISSSGYYSNKEMGLQLKCIKDVVKKYNKPFMFLEAGCRSRFGASNYHSGRDSVSSVNADEQAEYYKNLFSFTSGLPWFYGYGLWEWPLNLYRINKAQQDGGYCVYGKEASEIIKRAYL